MNSVSILHKLVQTCPLDPADVDLAPGRVLAPLLGIRPTLAAQIIL